MASHDDEIPLALVRRADARSHGAFATAVALEHDSADRETLSTRWHASVPPGFASDEPSFGWQDEDDGDAHEIARTERRDDRMTPEAAGAWMGLVAGVVGLGVVHLAEPAWVERALLRAESAWDLVPTTTLVVAYLGAAGLGAAVGAVFAAITRHLRRFVPLAVWAVIFFVSSTLVVVAAIGTYAGAGLAMTPTLLTAAAAYGLVASLELPLRAAGARPVLDDR